jgi:hypothetical protein
MLSLILFKCFFLSDQCPQTTNNREKEVVKQTLVRNLQCTRFDFTIWFFPSQDFSQRILNDVSNKPMNVTHMNLYRLVRQIFFYSQ